MARVVQALGQGGQRYAERALGWNRRTVRKGLDELSSGMRRIDQFALRGRQRTEERLPHLLDDIRAIVDSQSQTDLSHDATLYALECGRSSAATDRAESVYGGRVTLSTKLNELGYHLRSVQKSRPQKND